MTDLNKLTTAVERRQEFKTKSTPPSLEFSVKKPTPKIIEPKEIQDPKEVKSKEAEIEEVANKLSEVGVSRTENSRNNTTTDDKPKLTNEPLSENGKSDSVFTPSSERLSQSPERLLDSSTDSVQPSESSMESSQTYTSSLESSSHSPPPDDSSVSHIKVVCLLISCRIVHVASHKTVLCINLLSTWLEQFCMKSSLCLLYCFVVILVASKITVVSVWTGALYNVKSCRHELLDVLGCSVVIHM